MASSAPRACATRPARRKARWDRVEKSVAAKIRTCVLQLLAGCARNPADPDTSVCQRTAYLPHLSQARGLAYLKGSRTPEISVRVAHVVGCPARGPVSAVPIGVRAVISP
jgi:hypothetical protein